MSDYFHLNDRNFEIGRKAVFDSLDTKDGNADGKISASIWNEFADKVGGKHINEYINEKDAIKSINAYIKRGGEIVKQAIYDYLGWSTEKAHERLNNAEALLEDVAKDPSQVEITEGTTVQGNMAKKATLPDGRFILVRYNKSGEIDRIQVSVEVEQVLEQNSNKNYNSDTSEVMFDNDGKHVEAENSNPRNGKFDLRVTDGYDFEKYKALAEKIFGSENSDE